MDRLNKQNRMNRLNGLNRLKRHNILYILKRSQFLKTFRSAPIGRILIFFGIVEERESVVGMASCFVNAQEPLLHKRFLLVSCSVSVLFIQ